MSFYTIPATDSFCDTLAQFVDDLGRTQSIPLSKIKIYLPTKRAIRTLKEGFLRQSNGEPRILPQMMSIGDSDEDELSFSDFQSVDIAPAIHPMRRQIILARLLERAWRHDYNYIQALALAADLGRLIDQIHTADISLDKLNTIISIREFAEHWDITYQFLNLVLGQLWPDYLASEGKIDPGLHRRLTIQRLCDFYKHQAPQYPVIVAGSTGSLPATRQFISTIAQTSQGLVILPELDRALDDQSWDKIEDSHPQFYLKKLLKFCEITRADVSTIGDTSIDVDKLNLISEIMRPAASTDKWQTLSPDIIANGMTHITQCECPNEDSEARTIALAMAEIAADPSQTKTCALITPDRTLSARVRALLSQWNIQIDDSAGTPLTATTIGRFCLSLTHMIDKNILMPVPFLAAMKNQYAGGGDLSSNFRSTLRQFEKDYLRGLRPSTNLVGLKSSSDKHHDFIDAIHHAIAPFYDLTNASHSLDTWLDAHITMMENIAATQDMDGALSLWVGHEGEALADFFENLRTFSDVTPPLNHHDYIAFIEQLMQPVTTRPPYGTHPRLSILGQIESRMVQADRVILGGLVEGTWPPESDYDAFLSRQMRKDFGLPALEQKTALAAHDFATALGSTEVFITYSARKGGSPIMPSRWIQRMETVLSACNIDKAQWPITRGYQYIAWADELRHMNVIPKPIERPRPCPPIERRPREFSVTDIEKWMRDPYFIYAKRVLKLKKLDPVDMDITAKDKGNLIHNAMEQFTQKFPKQLLDNAYDELIAIGDAVFKAENHNPEIHGLWWPRFVKTADWLIRHEQEWRPNTDMIYAEQPCQMTIPIDGTDFILKGKADRIEKRRGNEWAIIDYKTGTAPAKNLVTAGIANQLPLEAYLLSNHAFASVTPPSDAVYELYYWSLNGSGEGGKIEQANDKKTDVTTLVEEAAHGLVGLLSLFHKIETPYIASPNPDMAIRMEHNDYAHLERIAEWSVIEGED